MEQMENNLMPHPERACDRSSAATTANGFSKLFSPRSKTKPSRERQRDLR
jgi:phosphoribosylformylglycinamidine (FGAM) synthase-like amidotransferase family enzyme